MSFPSEPGRDDGNLPPVNVVIPDDARELDRDVLAYRRELRARRRRERLLRFIRPFSTNGIGSGAAIIPLIAACLAISLVGGALLSVMTITPAHAPTVASPASSLGGTLAPLPAGGVEVAGHARTVNSLASSVIAVIPANCGCDKRLQHIAGLAKAAHDPLYFVGTGSAIRQLPQLSASFSGGNAIVVADRGGVFDKAYQPSGLLLLLAYADPMAILLRQRQLPADQALTRVLRTLRNRSS